jgi:GNAT superfamily N-acetyltransferase
MIGGVVEPEIARASDVAELVRLRDDLALWQSSHDLPGWRPGEVGAATFEAQVGAGEWHVLRHPEVIAALRLLVDDPAMWGAQPADAVYVHGLMVARTHAGRGLGGALLRWAEQRARDAGRGRVRLDCIAENRRLVGYYEAFGYARVGQKTLPPPWHAVALLEKQVGPPVTAPANAVT